MLTPLAVLMATDFFLTVFSYNYAFKWEAYVPTWIWYAAAMVLGRILLSERATAWRVVAAALLGPTSFFVVSNFAVWVDGRNVRTFAGRACGLLCGGDSLLPQRSGFNSHRAGRGHSAFPRCCAD